MSKFLPSFLLIALLVCTGCLRYVPARDGMPANLQENIGGEDQFFAYEKSVQDRLQRLVEQRVRQKARFTGPSAYQIGAGDLLELRVFESPDLNTTSRVTPAGTLPLPLIGEIPATGRTLAELQGEISERLKSYVRNPQIHLGVVEYESSKVSVIGEVARPGVYALKRRDFTLTEVLSEAGGRTERASSRIILVPADNTGSGVASASAAGDGKVVVSALTESSPGVEIDMEQLVGDANRRPLQVPLHPGDTIIVPEAGSFQVDGEVERPGSYPLSSRVSAMGAIAAAGGLTYSADVNKVEVIRDVGAGQKAAVTLDLEDVALKGGTDVRLRNGDFVRVPSAPGRFGTRQVVELLNGFFRMGLR